jgi:hypothetical protein
MECPGHQATDECYYMLLQVHIRWDGSVSRESTLPCWAAVLPCWEVDGQPAIYRVGTRTKAQRSSTFRLLAGEIATSAAGTWAMPVRVCVSRHKPGPGTCVAAGTRAAVGALTATGPL